MVKNFAIMRDREESKLTEPVVSHACHDRRVRLLIERDPVLTSVNRLAQSRSSCVLNVTEVALREPAKAWLLLAQGLPAHRAFPHASPIRIFIAIYTSFVQAQERPWWTRPGPA